MYKSTKITSDEDEVSTLGFAFFETDMSYPKKAFKLKDDHSFA